MANLDSLPIELVEKIATNLDIDSIKSLRVVCKLLAANASGPRFQSFIGFQKIDLSWLSLRKLASIAHHPEFRKAVTNIKFLGMVYDTAHAERLLLNEGTWVRGQNPNWSDAKRVYLNTQEVEEAKLNHEWLLSQKQALPRDNISDALFHLVQSLRKFPRLSAIEVDSEVTRGKHETVMPKECKDWPAVFRATTDAFQTALAAIMLSKYPLQSLDVSFETEKCSIPVVDMTWGLERLNAKWTECNLSSLKSFSISIATMIEVESAETESVQYLRSLNGRSSQYEIEDWSFEGFIQLLSQMTESLEELKIHMFNTYRGMPEGYNLLFPLMARELRYTNLRRCTIQGVPVTEKAMLKWLDKHPNLEYLELDYITLGPGSWTVVFEHLSRMPKLQKMKLSSLTQHDGYVQLRLAGEHIDIGDRSGFPTQNGGYLIHTREFARHEFEEGLKFASKPTGSQLGSPEFNYWVRQKQERFGPP